MLPLYTAEIARTSLLKRVPMDDQPVSPRILESIKTLFGEPLSPEEAVIKILEEVRADGDRALQKWSRILDGCDSSSFRVPLEVIQSAASYVPLSLIHI